MKIAMHTEDRERNNGLIFVVISSIIRGFQGFFVRVTQWTENHTMPLTFFRLAIPALVVYVALLVRGKRITGIFTKEKLPVHGTSLFVALRMSFFFLGYAYADLSSATVVFFASGIFLTLLEPWVFGEKFSKRTAWVALLGFLGVLIVFFDQTISLRDTKFLGLVFMAMAGVLIIVEIILKKKFVARVSSVEWVFYQGFVSSIFLSPVLFFFPWPTAEVWPWILLFAIVIGVFGFVLDMAAYRRVRISDLSIARYVEPMSTMMVGFFIFHEQFTWNKILGAAIVFTSVYLTFKRKPKQLSPQ